MFVRIAVDPSCEGGDCPSVHVDTDAEGDAIVVGHSLLEEEVQQLNLAPEQVANRLPRPVLNAAVRELGLAPLRADTDVEGDVIIVGHGLSDGEMQQLNLALDEVANRLPRAGLAVAGLG